MFWSRGLVKSRQKNWRESRSRETEVGEKIAPTTTYNMVLEFKTQVLARDSQDSLLSSVFTITPVAIVT